MSVYPAAALRDARLKLVEEHCLAENNHDLKAIMETFGRNPVFGLNDLEVSGRETVEGLYAGFGFGERGSFSDLRIEVVNRHVNDETIILEITLGGKHTGDWNGLAPTGKEFRVPACAVFTFDDEGRLAGEKVYADLSIILRQFGVIA
ncbi:MAG TPA: ester cyclase [Blastocatellia bacterium]|nr:ester cyclase [Blastocatellia bacterium]